LVKYDKNNADQQSKANDGDECCGGHCTSVIQIVAQSGHKLEMEDHQEQAPQQPTEEQEESWEKKFFFIYHLHMQPSEYDKLSELERDWLFQRFIHQKKMEKELMEQARRQHRTGGGIMIPEPSLEL
jgi:hypothetical protein